MSLSKQDIQQSFAFDEATVDELKTRWLELQNQSVWANIKSSKIGNMPRLRKRILEVGENLRSVLNDRSWIPQPREQIKGAMGAMLNLRDSLLNLERSAKLVDGGNDFKQFEIDLLAFRKLLLEFMEKHEAQWADLLESLYNDSIDDEDE